jgi:hypothetical protein
VGIPPKVNKIRIYYRYTLTRNFKGIAAMVDGGDAAFQVHPEQKTAFLNSKNDRIIRRSCGYATKS